MSGFKCNQSPSSSATDAEVAAAIAALINGAGSATDTFGEVETLLGLKANLAGPTFTGTVAGITAAMVGLGSANNTSDANKPVSTAQQAAIDLKANLAGPTFTGTVVLPATTSIGNVSATELAFLDNVTSAIQTQLNSKVVSSGSAISGGTFTGTTAGIARISNPTYTNNDVVAIDFGNAQLVGGTGACARIAAILTDAGAFLKLGTSSSYPSGITNTAISISPAGKVGLGIDTAAAILHVLATTEQLRLGYDATHYAGFTINAAGKLVISSIGTPEIAIGSAITDLLGFYGLATGVARRAGATQAATSQTQTALTDNSAGTPGTTLAAIGGITYNSDVPAIRNWIASIAAELALIRTDVAAQVALTNELRAALVALNFIKGSA